MSSQGMRGMLNTSTVSTQLGVVEVDGVVRLVVVVVVVAQFLIIS